MPHPQLATCTFLNGWESESRLPDLSMPEDCERNPLKYLPPPYVLSEAELDLASRYERGDFSGGYVTSQIARFRRGQSADDHAERRERFRALKGEAARLGLQLPAPFVEIVESDEYVDRMRHNNIWLALPNEIVPLPSAPEHKLFLIFIEGQGCGNWHLLLSPDGTHMVTWSEHPFGLSGGYPPGREPDPAQFEVLKCAENFSQWIVNYFFECLEYDRHYEQMLKDFPNK